MPHYNEPEQWNNWILGNEILYRVIDELKDIERTAKPSHPEVSKMLRSVRLLLGPTVNKLMDEYQCTEVDVRSGD